MNQSHSYCNGDFVDVRRVVSGPNILNQHVTAIVDSKECEKCGFVKTVRLVKGDERFTPQEEL